MTDVRHSKKALHIHFAFIRSTLTSWSAMLHSVEIAQIYSHIFWAKCSWILFSRKISSERKFLDFPQCVLKIRSFSVGAPIARCFLLAVCAAFMSFIRTDRYQKGHVFGQQTLKSIRTLLQFTNFGSERPKLRKYFGKLKVASEKAK